MSRKRAPLILRPSNTDFDWRITCKELSESTDANRIIDLSVTILGVIPTDDANSYMSFMKLLASKLSKIKPSPLLRQELIRFLARTVETASTVVFSLVRYLIKHDRVGPVQWSADAVNLSVLLSLELAAWDSLSDGHLHRDVVGRTLARRVDELHLVELSLVGIHVKPSGYTDPIYIQYRRIIWHEDLENLRIPSTGKSSGLLSCLVLNVLFWTYMLEGDEGQAVEALELIPGNAGEEVENQTRVLLSQLGCCDLYGNTSRLDKLIQAAQSGECFSGIETCTGENRYEIALLCLLRAQRANNIIDSVSHALYTLHCLKFSSWIRDRDSSIHFGSEGMIAAFYTEQVPFSSLLPSIPPLQRYYIALEAVRIASRGYEQIGYVPGASWLLHRGLEYMRTLDRNDLVRMRLTRYREIFKSRLRLIHLTSRTAIPDSHIDHSLFGSCADGESLRDSSVGIDTRLRMIREIVRKQHVLHSRNDLSHLERLDLVLKHEPLKVGSPSETNFTVKFTVDPEDNLQVSIGGHAVMNTCRNVTTEVLDLYLGFSDLLMRNKEAIASTSDSKTFWAERRILNEEMGHLLNRMDDELIGDLGKTLKSEINSHLLVYLELPDILLGLPIERFRFLRDKICVRTVRIGRHPLSSRESSIRPSFVINPNGDCATTETTILPLIKDTWKGRSGSPTMSDHEFVDLLKDSNVFLFSGHGGGEKHWSGSLVQRLGSSEPKIALLMGCSSARPYGDYWASFITPFHYMIGGFRIVVGTLWDVLGRELDRMTRKIIESISNEISLENLNRIFFHIIHEARAQAKLDHLSAASLVVYVASN